MWTLGTACTIRGADPQAWTPRPLELSVINTNIKDSLEEGKKHSKCHWKDVCTSTGKSGDVTWGLMKKEFALSWTVLGLGVVMISYVTSLNFSRTSTNGNFPPIRHCPLPISCLQQMDQTCCVPEMTLVPPHCVLIQKWTQ